MDTMRQMFAAHTGLAVFLSFFAAPFLHLHTAAETEDHHHDDENAHGAIIHAHLPENHADDHGDIELTHPEEQEISLSVFAVVVKERSMPDLPFLIKARLKAAPPACSAEPFVPACPPRAHGPPALRTTQPRAPPA